MCSHAYMIGIRDSGRRRLKDVLLSSENPTFRRGSFPWQGLRLLVPQRHLPRHLRPQRLPVRLCSTGLSTSTRRIPRALLGRWKSTSAAVALASAERNAIKRAAKVDMCAHAYTVGLRMRGAGTGAGTRRTQRYCQRTNSSGKRSSWKQQGVVLGHSGLALGRRWTAA
jgi:hypothetical protein